MAGERQPGSSRSAAESVQYYRKMRAIERRTETNTGPRQAPETIIRLPIQPQNEKTAGKSNS